MKKIIARTLLYWLIFGALAAGAAGAIYIGVHQHLRQGANDPQIRSAEAAVRALEQGADPEALIAPYAKGEVSECIDVFLAIFDASGSPIASSVTQKGELPHLPIGVFTTAQEKKINLITWQPEEDAREAIVVMPYSAASGTAGYVVTGKLLDQVEKRIASLGLTIGTYLLWTLGLLFVILLVIQIVVSRHAHPTS